MTVKFDLHFSEMTGFLILRKAQFDDNLTKVFINSNIIC